MCTYICLLMASKTITITEEAYNALKSAKGERESFTDAILKVAKKDPLGQLVGILSQAQADDIRRNIRLLRRKMEKEVMETVKRFNDS
jgi:predicted CopG family antitoxin